MPPSPGRLLSCHRWLLAAAVLAAALLGCASDDSPDGTYTASGSVCASADDGALTFSAGFEPCFDPCITTVQSCSATIDGSFIRLSTLLERTGTTGASECATVCEPRVATCALPLPPPGNYILIVDGGRTATLAVPGPGPIALFGEGGCAQPWPADM
jgi:hypothetical protein